MTFSLPSLILSFIQRGAVCIRVVHCSHKESAVSATTQLIKHQVSLAVRVMDFPTKIRSISRRKLRDADKFHQKSPVLGEIFSDTNAGAASRL